MNRTRVDGQVRTAALAALTAIAIYLVYRLIVPFFPALTWATALAVCALPLHRRLKRGIKRKTPAALAAVAITAIVVVLPAGLVTRRLLLEADQFRHTLQNEISSGNLSEHISRIPQLQAWLPWLETELGIALPTSGEPSQENGTDAAIQSTEEPQANRSATVRQAAGLLTSGVGTVIAGLFWLLGQLFITFLALFFFFRDHESMMRFLRNLLPLSERQTNRLLVRMDDTIHATVYGSLAVAAIQGAMGGTMFWYLGLPAPVLWGAIMGLLAVVPVLGTFVVWGPTAVYLAFQGKWADAFLLAAWGGVAIALVDNFIYPYLVGKRLRYHALPVFLAIVGGLTLFGASGVILGPLILAAADALIEVWREEKSFALSRG